MKQKSRLILLLALVAVLVAINLWRSSPPAATTLANAPAARGRPARQALTAGIPDALLRVAERNPSARVERAARGRNIFEYAPVAAPVVAVAAPVGPPPAPLRPPAPVRFYGFTETKGGQRRIFLTDGEEIYVAAEGDVILRRYRVARVRNESIELEEIAGTNRWVIPLEQP